MMKTKLSRADVVGLSVKYGGEQIWDAPPVIFFTIGEAEAKHRVLFAVATHGVESAPTLALEWALEKWADSTPNDVCIGMLVVDPESLEEESYGFTAIDGRESGDPPQRGYGVDGSYLVSYYDQNSAFALSSVGPRATAIREKIEEFSPTFVLAAHETVMSGSYLWWNGAGLMSIESYRMHPSHLNLVGGCLGSAALGGPMSSLLALLNPTVWLRDAVEDWLSGVFNVYRYRRNAKHLQELEDFQLITRMIARYKAMGGQMLSGDGLRRYENQDKGSVIGEGRLQHAVFTAVTDLTTLVAYCTVRYGCPGVTTETFPPGRAGTWGFDERATQQLQFLSAVVSELGSLEKG